MANDKLKSEINALFSQISSNLESVEDIKATTKEQKTENKITVDEATIKKQLQADINNKMEFYYWPPRFLKPAFFLDELAPYLKVTLITDLADPYNPSRRLELFDTLSQGEASNNHLSSFQYDSNQEGGDMCTITLVDIEQTTVDQVVYMLSSIQNGKLSNGKITGVIYIEVKYGWCPNKDAKRSNSDYSNDYGMLVERGGIKEFVRFTKTLYMVPGADDGQMGIKVEYQGDGMVRMTISGTVDQTFPDPFKSISPMSIMGPMPATNLTLFNLDRIMYYIVLDVVKSNFSRASVSKFLNIMSGDLRLKQSKPLMTKLLIGALNFYLRSWSSTTLMDNGWAIRGLFEEEMGKIKLYKDKAETQPINYAFMISDLKRRLDRMTDNEFKKLTKDKDVRGSSGIYTQKPFKDLPFVSDFYMVSGIKGKEGHQMYLYNILSEYKNMDIPMDKLGEMAAKYAGVGQSTFEKYAFIKATVDYYQSLGLFAQEMKLHPYYLYNYVMAGLEGALEMNDLDTHCKIVFLDYGALSDGTISVQEDRDTEIIATGDEETSTRIEEIRYAWDTSLLEKGNNTYKGNVMPFCKSNFKKMRWTDKEAYYFPAHEFNTNVTDSWSSYLSGICAKLFVMYDVRNTAHAEKLVGKDQAAAEVKEQKVKDSRGLKKIPIRLKQQMFITTAYEAIENINIQSRIIRQMIMLGELEGNKTVFSTSMITSMKNYRAALEKKKGVIKSQIGDNYKYLVCIRDVVNTDSVFDADMIHSQILQAFSYRTLNLYDSQFDPGMKSCWNVNFPDVMEFNPEYNSFQAAMEVTKNAHYISDTTEISQVDEEAELESIKKRANELNESITKAKNKTSFDVASAKNKLSSMVQEVTNLTRLSSNTTKYGLKYQFGHYGDTFVAESGETAAQTVLRTQQTMRRRMLLSTNVFNATLKFLGDANFDMFSRGKYIFLKYVNNDGGLGFFTGVYNIMGVSQNIEPGKFSTTLKLSYYPLLDTAGSNQSLEKIIVDSDIMRVKEKINAS